MTQWEVGMSSKAARKRNKKRHRQAQETKPAPSPAGTQAWPSGDRLTARPTPERMAHGKWVSPQGSGKHMQPMVDMASDMLGRLYISGQITTSQEQAARTFQQVRAAYIQELGTKGYGSCLADNQSGYDGGDGDPSVIAEYTALEWKVGRINIACLKIECDKSADQSPGDLGALRRALDAVAG